MLRINKVLTIPDNPFRKEAVDLKILQMVEDLTGLKPTWDRERRALIPKIDYVEKKELVKANGRRRFLIVAAHGMRDK